MGERICEKTRWHEMEGPVMGGREHYQEKSYGGFKHNREPFTKTDERGNTEKGEESGDVWEGE